MELIVSSREKNSFLTLDNMNSEASGAVCWSPPPHGFWKLNCDGSVTNNGREARCGGLLRDSHGSFVFGFSHSLDVVLESEL